MTIFTRDFIHQMVLRVLLPLFVSCFLPFVTCQQESESGDHNRTNNASMRTTIGIIVLGLCISSMLFCCLFYAASRVALAADGREVLQSGARSGIDKDIIESFPRFLYSEVKGLKIYKGRVECTICLHEFEDEETLRWMPPCSHIFHASCIDVWLSSRSTCPVCRANLSLKHGESFSMFSCPSMDLETGNARRCVLQSPDDISLTGNSVTWNNNSNYRIPRSRSTGLLSSGRTAEIFYPKSHSTGHSLDQLGENLDRFTLQLPEEVQRHLVSLNLIKRSRITLPHARSSRQGYRSGSVGSSHIKGRV